jgi:uncharacterized protein YndB with AHSA1/START domain
MNTDRIEKKILLRAPRARVWRALTNSTEFGNWFGMAFDGPFRPGARMNGIIVGTKVNAEVAALQKAHEGKKFEITIEQMEPEKLFSFRWHPHAVDPNVDYSGEPTTLIAFKLEEKPEGILVTVTESGFDQIPLARRAEAFEANEKGWGLVIKLVEEYLAQNH